VPKNEPVMMVLNRTYTLTSTLGHMLSFKKDVPMSVPSSMIRACGEIGAIRVDGEPAVGVPEEIEGKLTQPVDPGHRAIDIAAAIETLVTRNEREDFTAAGMPNIKSVSKEVDYRVDRSEVVKVWRQRAEDLANETE